MKVTNWRRKLAASLVAGGLLAPAAASAANVDDNLVVDPGFENVTATEGSYFSLQLMSWAGGSRPGFAYAYSLNYDEGTPPAGGGNHYFTGNGQDFDFTLPEATTAGQVAQEIDVSAGATAALISSGEAAVTLSAQMTSYRLDFDVGRLQVDFLSAGGATLGSVNIKDRDAGYDNVWSLNTGASGVPFNTAKVRVSVFADPKTFGPDGYIDNIDVRVTSALDEVPYLEINTGSGVATLKNQSGEAIRMDYFEVTSASSAINSTGWEGFQEQGDVAGFPPGNGQGTGWEVGSSNAKGITESNLAGKSLLANGASIPLGNLYAVGGAHDLVFKYSREPETDLSLEADFDVDADVDGKDFLAWQAGFGLTDEATRATGDADNEFESPDVDATDFHIWAEQFGGFADPNILQVGAVRYVSGAATGVPEPGSVILAGMALAPLVVRRMRKA